jgi:hypothetical protein
MAVMVTEFAQLLQLVVHCFGAEGKVRNCGCALMEPLINGIEEHVLRICSGSYRPQHREHNPDPLPSVDPERPHEGTLARQALFLSVA